MANNIFVIDDDVELTVLLEEFLSSHGYHVLIFNNPFKALDALLKKSHLLCDLVILDIMMPELDGFQVLRKIRESSNVPVIMLSAKGKVADRVVGLELGADDYLAKPFEPQELLARIQSILRRVSSSNAMIDIVEFDGLSVNKIKQDKRCEKLREFAIEQQLIELDFYHMSKRRNFFPMITYTNNSPSISGWYKCESF